MASHFIIEKTQKIQGQEKRLYYRGDMTWTTVYDQRREYKTREEAEKDNDLFIRDVLNIHRDTSGTIVSEVFELITKKIVVCHAVRKSDTKTK